MNIEIMEDIIDCLFTAMWYDYYLEDVKEIVTSVKTMIMYHGTRECMLQASYIFKVLVLLYGDYGVAPAVGWIDDKNKKSLIKEIDKWCDEMHIFEKSEGET